jgi:hypothetical protein
VLVRPARGGAEWGARRLEPAGVVGLHAAELVAPPVIGLLGHLQVPSHLGHVRTLAEKPIGLARSLRMICSGVCLRRAIVMSLLRPAILGNGLSQWMDQSQGFRPYALQPVRAVNKPSTSAHLDGYALVCGEYFEVGSSWRDTVGNICTITLSDPIAGSVTLARSGDRATEACDASDAMKSGDLPFEAYLAEAVELVRADLDADRKAKYDAWLATIPLDVIERVRATVDACVPRNHKCANGGPHRDIFVEIVDDTDWGRVETLAPRSNERRVLVYGPAPGS